MKLFSSEQCAPCKQIESWIGENNLGGEVVFSDIGDSRDEAIAAGVRSVPALLVEDKLVVGFEPIRAFLKGKFNGTK